MEDALKVLLAEGTQKNLMDKMMTRKQQYEVIRYDYYEKLDKELA
jgi:methylisocitrate lyase